MRKIIGVTFIFLLAIITGCEKSGNERPLKAKVEIGSVAPDFILRDMTEKNRSLSDYKGRVVLITFWNMKCKDCTESMPSLETLNQRFKDQGLAVISINADNLEYVKPEKIINFIKAKGYTFDILFDETFSASETYKIVAIPMTFLIDRKGVVSYMKFGKEDWTRQEDIELVQNLLKMQ
ncbi:MAG: TlpA disulfide reductase family protein [Nanoarchaeota archaeon]